MTESANVALMRRWFEEVWNQRKDSTVIELMDPKSIGHLEGLVTHGIEAFIAARDYLFDAFPDFRLTIEDAISQDAQVAIRWSATGTHRGPFLGASPTGTAVSFRGLTWCTFKDGRMVEGWDSWNSGALLAMLSAAQTTENSEKA